MIGEFDVAGVFIPAIVIWAIVSMALGLIVRRILTATRFYALVWHRGLFDLALFFILWSAVAFLANRYGLPAGIEP
jgi:hypothetical protein